MNSHFKYLPLLFLVFDGIVIVLHLTLGAVNPYFNLDFEQNFPTIYQAIKLLLAGVLGLLLVTFPLQAIKKRLRIFQLGISFALIGIAVDEMFQVHENIYRAYEIIPLFHPANVVTVSYNLGFKSSLWLLYYIPIFVIAFGWMSYWIRYFYRYNQGVFKLLIAISCLIIVVLLSEYFSSTGVHSQSKYEFLILVEESAELMVGSLLSLLVMRLSLTKSPSKQPALSKLLP